MLTTIKQFSEYYDQRHVYYDPAFQRRVVWLALHGWKYTESLTRGWSSYSKIVVVNVRKSLAKALAAGDQVSVEYFEKVLNMGYEYISVDGQNRSKYLEGLINNDKKTLLTGEFIDADGIRVSIKNKYFKDLPVRLKDSILNATLDVHEVVVESKSELSELFQSLNAGVPLNEQELRHSSGTPVSDWVRAIREVLAAQLVRIVHEDKIPRMEDDELAAKMLMVLVGKPGSGDWGLSTVELDQFYEVGSDFYSIDDKNFPYSAEAQKRAKIILHNWSLVIDQQDVYTGKRRVPFKLAWASLYACAWAYDNSMVITNYRDFFSILKAIDDKLTTDSESEYAAARSKALQNKVDPDTVKKSAYYFNWVSLPHQVKDRNKRILKLSRQIEKKSFTMSLRRRPDSHNDTSSSELEEPFISEDELRCDEL
jgi:hypothetical protein